MPSGLHDPPLGEADTRAKLIDPAIDARGRAEEHLQREETAGAAGPQPLALALLAATRLPRKMPGELALV